MLWFQDICCVTIYLMDDYTRLLNKMFEDPEFKKEWDKLEPEYQAIRKQITEGLCAPLQECAEK